MTTHLLSRRCHRNCHSCVAVEPCGFCMEITLPQSQQSWAASEWSFRNDGLIRQDQNMPHFYGLVLADNHRQCLLYGDHIRLSLDGGNGQRSNWPSKRLLILKLEKLYLGIFCRALNGKGWSSWWRQSGGTFGSAFLAPASVSVHQSSN